jgi:hypothetical protein
MNGISSINGSVTKKRITADDVSQMEDYEYRDLMREELVLARRNLGKRSSVAGSILTSMILLVAAAAVIMHNMGLIQLPK